MSETDAPTQNRLDTGHEVSDIAKELFPGGQEVAYDAGNY